jgi:hypothetical protein
MGLVLVSGEWRPVREAYALLDLLNHPGHSSQKSHGRKGGGAGGGVREAIANAQSIDEVNAAVANEIRRVSGNETHVDLAGADLDVAKEYGEGVVRGLEHTPSTRLTDVATYGPGGARPAREGEGETEYANARSADDEGGGVSTEIGFNMAYAADPARFRASLAEDAKTGPDGVRGSASSDAGPMGVAIHEFGHVASSQVPWTHEKVTLDARGEVMRRTKVDIEFEAASHVGDLSERETGSRYGNGIDTGPRAIIGREISMYASWERGETTAEAFADVVLHGDAASTLSHDIYAMVTRGAGGG